jgi:hypothetical protein
VAAEDRDKEKMRVFSLLATKRLTDWALTAEILGLVAGICGKGQTQTGGRTKE